MENTKGRNLAIAPLFLSPPLVLVRLVAVAGAHCMRVKRLAVVLPNMGRVPRGSHVIRTLDRHAAVEDPGVCPDATGIRSGIWPPGTCWHPAEIHRSALSKTLPGVIVTQRIGEEIRKTCIVGKCRQGRCDLSTPSHKKPEEEPQNPINFHMASWPLFNPAVYYTTTNYFCKASPTYTSISPPPTISLSSSLI